MADRQDVLTKDAAPDRHPAAPAAPCPSAAGPGAVDQAVAGLLEPIGSRSGVALLCRGPDAFGLRVAMARGACRSLDLQYYLWQGDATARALAQEILAAADRGVRVRLLLDGAFAIGHDRILAAVDCHPNIEVRLFNGTSWCRLGWLGFALEMLLGGWHLNRRMHNKLWITDARMAVGGGRNLGDEYFDAADGVNFRDLDLVIAGEATADAMAVFERYWQCELARPAMGVSAVANRRHALLTLRRELAAAKAQLAEPFAQMAAAPSLTGPLQDRMLPVRRQDIRILADPPEKVVRGLGRRRLARVAGGLGPEVAEALRTARREALLISPYFVPGAEGLALLLELRARGVRVAVVTNSLAATDVVAVHGGYSRYRRRLLAAGVELYELKHSSDEGASFLGSRGASLHSKALVVDDGPVGVGSFNLDPRSALLNTEMSIFANHRRLAEELRAEHARLTEPAVSWQVVRDGARLAWVDEFNGERRVLHREPAAGMGRRVLSQVARWLPIEAHL